MSDKNSNQKVEERLADTAYSVFCSKLKKASNIADAYVDIDNKFVEALDRLKDQKSSIDHEIKNAKEAKEMGRLFLVKYVEENGINKVEGVNVKSINYQPAKTTIETVATRQIKVGTRYQNLDDVSRETLIEMLEARGIKTREIAEKVEVTKPASVRVMR